MRLRRNAGNLPAWDPILLWYARAVRAMQALPITDPRSWRFQAAVHAYSRGSDPLAVPGEALPSNANQSRFWSRCQHGSWFFLPWHRAYLLFFERVVAATVVSLGGPQDWALPFWNYAANTNARRLPAAFQAATLPDGSPNPLRVAQRSPAANSNQPVGSPGQASDTSCLSKPQFVNVGIVAMFGGGQTGFSHSGNVAGECERVPHAAMHGAVGGPFGWMSAFNTAALDPIFWLHHANIDRLWELWRRQDPSHTDPASAMWLTNQSFDFHDAAGNPVTITSSQMVNIADPFLDYDYEGLPPRPPVPAPAPTGGVLEGLMRQPIPEMVGATTEGVTLASEPGTVSLGVAAPTGPAAGPEGALEGVGQRHVHLVLENVKAPAYPVESYEVYVDVPEGANPKDHPELLAGILPGFGIVEATTTDEHGGSGVNHSFDITPIVETLATRGLWDAANVRVSFVPVRSEGDREPGSPMTPVRVSRVSVYLA